MGGGPSQEDVICVGDETYIKGRWLGRGSFSKVMAVQTETQEWRAMKLMWKALVLDKQLLAHIVLERQLLVAAQGVPFVVKLYRAFATKPHLCYVMELLRGGELRYHLMRGLRCKEDMVRFWAAQITLALEGLHERGIVHRDVKPENMIFNDKGYLFLTDFNGAVFRPNGERKSDSNFIGTIPYLPPEVLSDQPSGAAVDWWSLGITIYELLTGQVPFGAEMDQIPTKEGQVSFLKDKYMNEPIHFSSRLTPNVVSLLRGMLSLDPDTRYVAKDVKSHPFFEGIKWEELINQTLSAPYVPSSDTLHFDPHLELEESLDIRPDEEIDVRSISSEEDAAFNDWDWINPEHQRDLDAKRAHAFLSNPTALKQGVPMYEIEAGSSKGRVVFSLADIPSGLVLFTESGVRVERNKGKVKIGENFELSA